MPRVFFTTHLERHLDVPPVAVGGASVRDALEAVFADNPRMRGYVVDDRGRLRKHVVIFIDGRQIVDRDGLSDAVGESGELYVMQALSGG